LRSSHHTLSLYAHFLTLTLLHIRAQDDVDKLKSPERPKTEDEKAEEKKKDEEKQKELAEIEIKDGDYQVQRSAVV
jgi:hypothetical protein